MKSLIAAVAFLSCSVASAEAWSPFTKLLDETDYVAQYQELLRDGRLIGRRRIAVYWDTVGKSLPDHAQTVIAWQKPFSFDDFRLASDELRTTFVFYGRGQHLWTAVPRNDILRYPGDTAEHGTKVDVVCSTVEFHEVLKKADELRRAGKPLDGNLELPVLSGRKSFE